MIYGIHRVLVFFSKEGARWIIPLIMVIAGILLRSQIDAYAGVTITNIFDGWGDVIFTWRMEIVFAALFLSAYLALKIVSFVISPIVGALPAPRSPLRPLKPLFANEFKIIIQKAKIAVKSPRSGSFKGKLTRFNKKLPGRVQTLLLTSPVAQPAPAQPAMMAEPDMEMEQRQRAVKQKRPPPPASQPQPKPPQRQMAPKDVPPPRRQRLRATDPLQAESGTSKRSPKNNQAGRKASLPPRSTKANASDGGRGRLPPRSRGTKPSEIER